MLTRVFAAAIALVYAGRAAALDLQSTTVPGRSVPSLTNGEIAINRADKSLFFRNVDGTIGIGSLLNALPAGRKAVEAGDGSDLSVVMPLSGIARSASQRASDRIAIEDLGGGTDKMPAENCTALNDIRAKGRTIYLNDGAYRINCTITLPLTVGGRPTNLIGNGRDRTNIINITTNLPSIVLPAYTQYARLVGFTVDRSVTAVSGGDGIVALDNTSRVLMREVTSRKNRNGFNFGVTDVGYAENLEALENTQDGFFFTNNDNTTGGNKPLQWNFSGRTLSAQNGRDGYRVQANTVSLPTTPTSQLVMGQWDNLGTYANAGSGTSVLGAPNLPVQIFRLNNPFFGEDGGVEVYLDTYGKNHQINGGMIELSGTFGVYATGNNNRLNITGGVYSALKRNAIFSIAPQTAVSGVTVESSGTDTSASIQDRAGIVLAGPDSSVVGGTTDGGTIGVVVNGARGVIVGTSIANAAAQAVAPQPDTIVRGVRGRADAN